MCRAELPPVEFNVRRASRDGLQNVCRTCNRARAKRYYDEHRDEHVQLMMQRRAAARDQAVVAVGEHLLANPCVDCGEGDVRVLDFDHLPGSGKSAEVMRLVRNGYSVARVMVEIAKCEVRCRNCHAKVTYERLGNDWRTALMRRVADEGEETTEPDAGERDDHRDLADPG